MRHVVASAIVVVLAACAHVEPETAPTPPARVLDEAEIARLIPAKVKDREGWANDIAAAIRMTKKEPTPERACAVVAVVEQESGFDANPAVPHLPEIVRHGIDEKLASLGPLAETARDAILEGKAPNTTATFGERVDKLHTERDLDRLFRDIAAAYREQMPGTFAVASAVSLLLGKGGVEDLNPVTTAGSMQVKVSFAREIGRAEKLDDADVREMLYTRGGGVRFGTARLIGYNAGYDDITYRFADYNAGVYASRNAQVQHMLGELVGEKLVEDGDVLAYDKDGGAKDVDTNTVKALLAFGASHGLSAWRVHRDAKLEKSQAFEDTDTYKAIVDAWQAAHPGKTAPYARMPEVALVSPKLSKPRTTTWYASSVKRRYDACRALL